MSENPSDNGAGLPAHGDMMIEYLRAHLQQVVTLHTAMFEKLLFESPDLPLELAELFEDTANRYLDFAERISRHYRERRLLDVEEQLDPGIVAVRRMTEAKLRMKPRIVRAEDFAEPIEDDLHRPRVQPFRQH